MNDETNDSFAVSFPASETFARIGRVAVAGLALRLGVDIANVEKLRRAVDSAVEALRGEGTTQISASWQPNHLEVELFNEDAEIASPDELMQTLEADVDNAKVGQNKVVLELSS